MAQPSARKPRKKNHSVAPMDQTQRPYTPIDLPLNPKTPDSMAQFIPIILIILSAALSLVFTTKGTGWVSGFPLDDVWIHLVYARNLASFNGFAYNPGNLQTGFTSPAWVILLAPLFWFQKLVGLPIDAWVKLVNWACFFAASILSARFASILTKSRWLGFVAAIGVLIDPFLAFSSVSGMEVLLAGAVLLGFALSLLEKRRYAASLFAAVMPLVRPELAVFSLLFFLVVLGATGLRKINLSQCCALLIPGSTVGGVWLGYNQIISGRWLPATYYAKHSPLDGIDWTNIGNVAGLFFDSTFVANGVGMVALAIGINHLWRQGLRSIHPVVIISVAVLPFIFLAALSQTVAIIQIRPFYWHRYAEPILPLLNTLVLVGYIGWFHQIRLATNKVKWLGLVGFVLAIGTTSYLWVKKFDLLRNLYVSNVENIKEVQIAAADWVNANVEQSASVATNDAGAMRFFGNHTVLDIVGLNEFRILTPPAASTIRTYDPKYFIVHLNWLDRLFDPGQFNVVKTFKAKSYTICDCKEQDTIYIVTTKTKN